MGLKRVNWHALTHRVHFAMVAKGIDGLKSSITAATTAAAAAPKPAAAPINEVMREKLERKLESNHN